MEFSSLVIAASIKWNITQSYRMSQKTEYYSVTKEWNNAIWSNVDEPTDQTKWTESEKNNYMRSHCRVWNITQMKLFTKQKQTHRLRKQTYNYQSGKGVKVKMKIVRVRLFAASWTIQSMEFFRPECWKGVGRDTLEVWD